MMRMGLALILAAALSAGCGGEGGKPVASQTPNKDALAEVGEMLKTLAADGRKPPASPRDLDAVEPMLPTAAPLLREKQLTYLWGATYSADGTAIAAHEAKADSAGGWVLLTSGQVKTMTAAEFKAAPKAGGKK